MEIAIIFNKSNHFGLLQDVQMIRDALRSAAAGTVRVREVDPLEAPVKVDIAFHLEVPIYAWMPWSSVNVLLCNPEWFELEAWKGYLPRFDAVLFRCAEEKKRFDAMNFGVKSWVVPWACPEVKETYPESLDGKDGYIWFLGGSKNKREAAQIVLPLWKDYHSPLKVYTTSPLDISGLAPTVSIVVKDLDVDERKRLAAFYPNHLCFSKAESFGYAAAEAEANGALLTMNNLDVYEQDYGSKKHCGLLTAPKQLTGLANVADFTAIDREQWGRQLDDLNNFVFHSTAEAIKEARMEQKAFSQKRRENFINEFKKFYGDIKDIYQEKKKTRAKHLPPVLMPEDCPSISIVTLLYNRRKFFDLACHNIMLSDYPKDKIEWVIVEDSDDPDESASDRVIQVGLKSNPLTVVYVPLEKKTPISEKRNLGVKRAKNDIIVFMDDDDHYPETSFRRRVAWLLKHPWQPKAVGCTTIACYDLLRGVSAVNTPPWNLSLGQRVSEATLCFYKKWWEDRHFTFKQNLSEGEDFVKGRESEFLELPPQQIIVAFSHKKNVSGRRIPADDAKPGCFWGFPKEFLIYIHKLAGVEVEEDKSTS